MGVPESFPPRSDFSIDGFAGRALADAWTNASPSGREDIARAAGVVFTTLGGTSLTSIAILWGLPPILFGRAAALLEGFPSWLGWSGLAVGVATLAAATAQFLHPDLIPGFLIYGPLVFAVQLWSLALGLTVWRRAGDTHHPDGEVSQNLGSHPTRTF